MEPRDVEQGLLHRLFSFSFSFLQVMEKGLSRLIYSSAMAQNLDKYASKNWESFMKMENAKKVGDVYVRKRRSVSVLVREKLGEREREKREKSEKSFDSLFRTLTLLLLLLSEAMRALNTTTETRLRRSG